MKILITILVIMSITCGSQQDVKDRDEYCFDFADVQGVVHRMCFKELIDCQKRQVYLEDERPWYQMAGPCNYY